MKQRLFMVWRETRAGREGLAMRGLNGMRRKYTGSSIRSAVARYKMGSVSTSSSASPTAGLQASKTASAFAIASQQVNSSSARTNPTYPPSMAAV